MTKVMCDTQKLPIHLTFPPFMLAAVTGGGGQLRAKTPNSDPKSSSANLSPFFGSKWKQVTY